MMSYIEKVSKNIYGATNVDTCPGFTAHVHIHVSHKVGYCLNLGGIVFFLPE